MSRAEELRAKAQRLKQRQSSDDVERTEDDRERALAPTVAKPQVKPIRSTVDLPPTRHAALKAWCGETAVEIGRSRVTTQDVMRALVDRLLTDETLARTIRNDLQAE